MSELVFFLEEQSAKAMLDGLLPRILPQGVEYRCIVFEGKQDLEKRISSRIQGYLKPDARFIILRDQDVGDCRAIKSRLVEICGHTKHRVLVRIACQELESWYLADLQAVGQAFGSDKTAKYQERKSFRNPDATPSPSEHLKRILPEYQKVSGSRLIGVHLDADNRRSHSFAVFVEGVHRMCREMLSSEKPPK